MSLSRVFSGISIIVLLILLVGVRLFEIELFNDPLYGYFHSDFQLFNVPIIVKWEVVSVTSLRFLFNMVLSLWILWFVYKNENYINAALWVYLFAFVILMVMFYLLLEADSNFTKMFLFYVRRFLIQPILLFVLTAGFYFIKTKGGSNLA